MSILKIETYIPAPGHITDTDHENEPERFVNIGTAADPLFVDPEAATKEQANKANELKRALAARMFNHEQQPERPEPVLSLGGKPLSTAGNITNIQAGVKAGKSAAIGGIIAAIIRGNYQCGDCLGFESNNEAGKAVIHFDTEQSRFDADALIRRSIRRSGMDDKAPAWLMSYSLADIDTDDRRRALRIVMDEAVEAFGGIHAVIIDGVADLCGGLNDDVQAFGLVDELHKLSIRFDCPVITVLHENPGSEGGKTRGHLGSQLERKAETNLRLVKSAEGITTIFTEKSRHCHIPKAEGLCFQWSDTEGMHVSCGTAGAIHAAAKREKMQAEAEQVLTGDGMKYADLVGAIMDVHQLAERTAKERVKAWRAEGVILKHENGLHALINQ